MADHPTDTGQSTKRRMTISSILTAAKFSQKFPNSECVCGKRFTLIAKNTARGSLVFRAIGN